MTDTTSPVCRDRAALRWPARGPAPGLRRHHRRRAERRHHDLRACRDLVARQRQHRAAHLRHALSDRRRRRRSRPTWPTTSRSPRTGWPMSTRSSEGLHLPRRRGADGRRCGLQLQPRADPANAFTGNTPGFVFSLDRLRRAPRRWTTCACRSTSRAHEPDRLRPDRRGLHPLQGQLRGDDASTRRPSTRSAPAPTGSPTGRADPRSCSRRSSRTHGNFQQHRLADHPRSLDPVGRTDRRQRRHHHQRRTRPDRRRSTPPAPRGAGRAGHAPDVCRLQPVRRVRGRMPGGDAIQDPAVRRALQYAVDVPAICSQLLNFECERMTGIVNPPNANQSTRRPIPMIRRWPRSCWTRPAGRAAMTAPASRSASRRAQGRYLNDAQRRAGDRPVSDGCGSRRRTRGDGMGLGLRAADPSSATSARCSSSGRAGRSGRRSTT